MCVGASLNYPTAHSISGSNTKCCLCHSYTTSSRNRHVSIIDCRKLRKCRVEMTSVIITTTPTAINIRQLFRRLLEWKDKGTQISQYKLVFAHKTSHVTQYGGPSQYSSATSLKDDNHRNQRIFFTSLAYKALLKEHVLPSDGDMLPNLVTKCHVTVTTGTGL